jgi:hypothetical protein
MSQVAPRVITDIDDSSLGPTLAVLSKIGATVVRGCDTADKIIAMGPGVDDLPGEEL